MIVYSVHITLELDSVQEWLDYMLSKHIKDVISTSCFVGYEMLKEIDLTNSEKAKFRIDYYAKDESKMNEYLENHANQLRNDVLEHFGDKFLADRHIYNSIKSFK